MPRQISGSRMTREKIKSFVNGKKSGGSEVAGINTWVAVDNLAVVGATAKTETYRVHTVVKGDTLWGIAQKYLGSGTRYPEIMKLNGLTSTLIFSGQKLNIPN